MSTYPGRYGPLIMLCEALLELTAEATRFRRNDGHVQLTMSFPTVTRHPHRLIIRWAYDPMQSNNLVIRGTFIKVFDAAMEYRASLELCGVHLIEVSHIWANGPVFEIGLLVPEVFDEIKALTMGDWWGLERLCKALSTTPPNGFGISK
jgi:hypothetical protein